MVKTLLAGLLLLSGLARAAVEVPLLHAPINPRDVVSLQRGAVTFVNYCLNCHSANYMRYSRLTDLGLNEQQIRDNLILTGVKVGETMSIAMRPADAKQWFGVPPPDLSVIARARGADWLYTFFRSFYRDDTRSTGWNNLVFPNVGMPHPLYRLQGTQSLRVEKEGAGEHAHEAKHLALERPGSMTPVEYDAVVADLVNYLVYMGEPARNDRIRTGMLVMLFLGVLFVLAALLKREYWRGIH